MKNTLENKIDEILSRGVAEVIDKDDLKKELLSGKKLRIKLGIDPTSPNLHLGRAITLLKMKDLQDLGHQIVLIFGDATGVIGDTSDKDSERPMLSKEAVEKNLKTYKEQAGKILDLDKVEIKYNSKWLDKLGYREIGEHADRFSWTEFSSRENIRERVKEGKRVSLREVLYPLMQGYDSVAIKADVEIGGTDQKFNILAGRELQRHFQQKPQNIMLVNLIEGTDGRKMSSSWGNTINLTDDPNDMFGKIMSMPDDLIVKYFIHCTRVPMERVKKIESGLKSDSINPRDAKLELAFEIVKIYHGENEAQKAKEYFINTFSKKEMPEGIKEVKVDKNEIKLVEFLVLAGLAKSLSDARRKIEQGGVEINGKKVEDWQLVLNKNNNGSTLKIGKFGFTKIKF
ncbi:MAG: tyrosine--tRNA ligase [Candidatus Moranbacteria bacterium]|nr:tyrosine--tRNA ligase [Candidatus Moranbacteria bacterium]